MQKTVKPLLSKQSEILFDQLLNPDSDHRNIGGIIKLFGELEKEKLTRSFQGMASTYDIFSHEIKKIDNSYYNIFEDCPTYKFCEVDFDTSENPHSDAEIWYRSTFLKQVFSFDGSLIEIVLCKISNNEHWICLRTHHLIMDGYSYDIIIRSLGMLYTGKKPIPLRSSYSDTLQDFQTYLTSERYNKDESYWTNLLLGTEKTLHLPLNGDIKKDLVGTQVNRLIPIVNSRLSKWVEFARQNNCGMQNLTLLALKVLYSKLNRLDDFVVGITTHGRRSAERNTPGLYSSYLPVVLSSNLDQRAEDALKTINDQLRRHYRHLDFPISHLTRVLDPLVESNRMFDVIINELTVDLKLDWGKELKCVFEKEFGFSNNPLM